jgi:hypothetical protein
MNAQKPQPVADGVHGMVPDELMSQSIRKLRATYAQTPGAPLVHREFGFQSLDAWYEAGLDRKTNLGKLFGHDDQPIHCIVGLGGCQAAFAPAFEEKVLEDRGPHEVVLDSAGRHVLCFKGRRSGFMPEYIEHPVKDVRTWRQDVKWRLDPASPQRWQDIDATMDASRQAAAKGMWMSQYAIGGYMYLRSLIGPTEVMCAFYDMPELIHDCMKTWLELADAVTARHQQSVTFDELLFDEDICYNHGPLISPDMIKEFLLPYYQQLIANVRSRQLDPSRKLHVQIATDGFAEPVIPLYEGIGMTAMSPFEVASGCDVVEIGRKYPRLIMSGGIDKRVLAKGKDAIDRHLEHILPQMRQRGGYIPTCDHNVPAEVTLENYLHYCKRCIELGG